MALRVGGGRWHAHGIARTHPCLGLDNRVQTAIFEEGARSGNLGEGQAVDNAQAEQH